MDHRTHLRVLAAPLALLAVLFSSNMAWAADHHNDHHTASQAASIAPSISASPNPATATVAYPDGEFGGSTTYADLTITGIDLPVYSYPQLPDFVNEVGLEVCSAAEPTADECYAMPAPYNGSDPSLVSEIPDPTGSFSVAVSIESISPQGSEQGICIPGASGDCFVAAYLAGDPDPSPITTEIDLLAPGGACATPPTVKSASYEVLPGHKFSGVLSTSFGSAASYSLVSQSFATRTDKFHFSPSGVFSITPPADKTDSFTVIATDSQGCQSTAAGTITIVAKDVIAKLVVSDYVDVMNGVIANGNQSSALHSTGGITEYSFAYGDGQSYVGTSPVVSHLYSASGSDLVSLTVTTANGETDETAVTAMPGEYGTGSSAHTLSLDTQNFTGGKVTVGVGWQYDASASGSGAGLTVTDALNPLSTYATEDPDSGPCIGLSVADYWTIYFAKTSNTASSIGAQLDQSFDVTNPNGLDEAINSGVTNTGQPWEEFVTYSETTNSANCHGSGTTYPDALHWLSGRGVMVKLAHTAQATWSIGGKSYTATTKFKTTKLS
jgi:hypothetical protein